MAAAAASSSSAAAASAGGEDEPPHKPGSKSPNPKPAAGRGQGRRRRRDEGEAGENPDEGPSDPCSECGRTFPNRRSLYGHMRSHPNRPWRGANPPPEARGESEAVHGFLLLTGSNPPPSQPREPKQEPEPQQDSQPQQPKEEPATSQDDGTPPRQKAQATASATRANSATSQPPPPFRSNQQQQRQPSSPSSSAQTQGTPSARARIRKRTATPPPPACEEETSSSSVACPAPSVGDTSAPFVCNICQRVFDSYQALGGHRATHRNVRGCYATAQSSSNPGGSGGDQPPQRPPLQPEPEPHLHPQGLPPVTQPQPPPALNPPNPHPRQPPPRAHPPRRGRNRAPRPFNPSPGAGPSTAGAATSTYQVPSSQPTPDPVFTASGVTKVPLPYGCQMCDKRFPSGQALGGHMRWHLDRHEMPPPPAYSTLDRAKRGAPPTTTSAPAPHVPPLHPPAPPLPRFGTPFYSPPGGSGGCGLPPGRLPIPPHRHPPQPPLPPIPRAFLPPFLDPRTASPLDSQSALDAASELAHAYEEYTRRETERQRPTTAPGPYGDVQRYLKELQDKLAQGSAGTCGNGRGRPRSPGGMVFRPLPVHRPQPNPIGPPTPFLPPEELELFPRHDGHKGQVPPSEPSPRRRPPVVLPQPRFQPPEPQIFGWRFHPDPQQQQRLRRQQEQQNQQEELRNAALWRRRTQSPSPSTGSSSANPRGGPEEDDLRLQLKPPSPPPEHHSRQQNQPRRDGDNDSHDKRDDVDLHLSLRR